MPALTLQGAKSQLNIAEDVTKHDAELEDYVAAVNEIIEHYIGPVDDVTVTERWTGRRKTIAVRELPLSSLVGVTYLDDGSEVAPLGDIDVDTETGVLQLRHAVWWPPGRFLVEYTAGRGGTAPSSADIAARIIVQHLWATQRGGGTRRPDLSGVGDMEQVQTANWTFSVPRRAIQLLEARAMGPALA